MKNSGGSAKTQHGSSGPVKPSNASKATLPKVTSGKGVVQSGNMGSPPSSSLNSSARNPGYSTSVGTNFSEGWPVNMDHDPRLIAKVWRDGANNPYQVRTADGTFSMPKGMGQRNRGNLTKDKASNRNYVERDRPNVAGFNEGTPGRKSKSSVSGGMKGGK